MIPFVLRTVLRHCFRDRQQYLRHPRLNLLPERPLAGRRVRAVDERHFHLGHIHIGSRYSRWAFHL